MCQELECPWDESLSLRKFCLPLLERETELPLRNNYMVAMLSLAGMTYYLQGHHGEVQRPRMMNLQLNLRHPTYWYLDQKRLSS